MMKLIEAKQSLAKEWQRDLTNQEWAAEMELTEPELNRILHLGRRAKQRDRIEAKIAASSGDRQKNTRNAIWNSWI